MKKTLFLVITALIISSFFISGCGGGGGSSKTPDVTVAPDTATDGSGTNNDSGTDDGSGTDDDSGTNDDINYVVIIHTDSSGRLHINNEAIDSDIYNPQENSNSSITVTDENGNSVEFIVTDDGEIKIVPGDGTVEGEYTVVINTGEREYTLVIEVDENNNATVVTAVSNPAGSSIAVDLDGGALVANGTSYIISSPDDGEYSQSNSVESITVKDSNGNVLNSSIDPVTGDIIVEGDHNGPFTVTIVMDDGTVITFITDSAGSITGNASVSGSAVMVDLNNGSINTDKGEVSLTGQNSEGKWYLLYNVEILSATAGDGTINVDPLNIKVNGSTGDLMITGGASDSVPSGPYEIKVSINGELYIIKTDASGIITGIIPGNILLQLQNGYAIHSGNNIIKISESSNGYWGFNSSIDSFTAVDSNGNSIYAAIDSETGNIITTSEAAGQVTITFNYTDEKGNVITYTIIVQNGSLASYSALISDPGPDFDFSTVTNVKISLKVSDEKTGLPLGQVSINLMKSDNSLNWQGFTNSQGISVFTATVDAAEKTARVAVSREGYETVECSIDGIGRLVEFGRNIALKPVEDAVVIDSDGDGVPDEDDEYPDDPQAARKLTGVYTLAFEDLYPNKGDADFNDVVVRLSLEEKIDSQNNVREITIKTKLLASGAGYDSPVVINVYGNRIILIESPRALLGRKFNARPGETYLDIPETVHTITLNRARTETMPYDPFIICNGVEGNEAHLPFVETSFTGKVLDNDGFPWAILVPSDWSWPYESSTSDIYNAYPSFQGWYESDGSLYESWYLTPVGDHVFDK